MENSGYLALARQVALDRALDITANNLANLRTSGYKAEKLLFEQYVQRATSPVTPPNEMSSVVQVGTFTDYRPGDFQQTGNQLDFAIQGDGFFAVQDPAGTRYTRAGNFRLDGTGQVVTQDGLPVLDAGGSTIQLPQGTRQIVVSGNGNDRGRRHRRRPDRRHAVRRSRRAWCARATASTAAAPSRRRPPTALWCRA